MIRALVLVACSGCAAMTDGIWKLSGPNHRSSVAGAQHATDRAETWREISFDADGLVCTDVALPYVHRAQLAQQIENPNGFKTAMQFFTGAELLAAALIVGVHEHACATDGCGARAEFYPWFAPLALDLAWGIYRSLTIHDAIYRSSDISWSGPGRGDESEVMDSRACPAGLELPLVAGGETLTVQIGEAGRTPPALRAQLAAFVQQHAGFAVGGSVEVRLDARGAMALVAAEQAAARAAAPPAIAPPGPPPPGPPPPPPPPPGGVIDIDIRVPRR